MFSQPPSSLGGQRGSLTEHLDDLKSLVFSIKASILHNSIGKTVKMRLSVFLQAVVVSGFAFAESQVPIVEPSFFSGDFAVYQSQVSPSHSIRVKRQNSTLCNTPVDQYTGWLDVGHKHLFFWYFKSESASSKADDEPLGLW